MWWHTPIILALGRLRQKEYEFENSLGYIVSFRPARIGYTGIKSQKKKKKSHAEDDRLELLTDY